MPAGVAATIEELLLDSTERINRKLDVAERTEARQQSIDLNRVERAILILAGEVEDSTHSLASAFLDLAQRVDTMEAGMESRLAAIDDAIRRR